SRDPDRPLEELRGSIPRSLDAIIEALSTRSFEAVDRYLADISQLRWQLGFDIGEVIEGLLLLREAVLPHLRTGLHPGSDEAYQTVAAFDECLRYTLGRFGHLYAQAIRKHLEEQQRHTAIMEERQRLARALHDSVTQSLYSMTLYTEAAASMLAAGNHGKVAEHLQTLQETAQDTLSEMRLLIFELHPPILEKEGLVAALQARLDGVEARGGVQTGLLVEGTGVLSITLEEELYRIAQEALNNVLNHARARRVTVRLRLSEEETLLEITDDGIGFDQATVQDRRGFGLSSMDERVRMLGGALQIESRLGEGTRVTARIPGLRRG
ncbi:MAG TPA: histidine kinase, partial [Chloroflexota bacterium]|nr:histidine kinase [Chloroflexota bacterium]